MGEFPQYFAMTSATSFLRFNLVIRLSISTPLTGLRPYYLIKALDNIGKTDKQKMFTDLHITYMV